MVDKVKPLKIETSGDGTQDDLFPTELNPSEDYVAAKGLAAKNQDSTIFDLSASDEWQWKDSVQTNPFKLNDIFGLISNTGRWFLLHHYVGNAQPGRFLNIFPAQDSNEAPLMLPTVPLKAINIVARAVALSTGTVSYYDDTTLLYDLVFNNQTEVIVTGSAETPVFTLPAGGQLKIKVSDGTILKPHIYLTGIAQ